MKFEFLIICKAENDINAVITDALQQALEDNSNEISPDEISGLFQITHKCNCPDKIDNAGLQAKRILCSFTIKLDESTENIPVVIEDLCGNLESSDGVDHLLKFYDEVVVQNNIIFAKQLFQLEMKLRKVLSLIYICNYSDGYYNLLRDETVEIMKKDGQKPTEQEMNAHRENEFFHLLFSQYTSLNKRRLPKNNSDLIQLISDSESYDILKQELLRNPVTLENQADFVASLKPYLDPIEKLRNCIAHNRCPSQDCINQFKKAAPELEAKLDEFMADVEHYELAHWEQAAYMALDEIIESAEWNIENHIIKVQNPNTGEQIEIKSKEEYKEILKEVAEQAYLAHVPFEGGEAVFSFDSDYAAAEAIESMEDELDKFFPDNIQ